MGLKSMEGRHGRQACRVECHVCASQWPCDAEIHTLTFLVRGWLPPDFAQLGGPEAPVAPPALLPFRSLRGPGHAVL